MDLNLWIVNVHSARRKISDGSPDLIVVTDASESGWGAVCEDEKIGGRWSLKEKQNHINFSELLAIQLALKAFCIIICNWHVLIQTDNVHVTALTYVNKMGA